MKIVGSILSKIFLSWLLIATLLSTSNGQGKSNCSKDCSCAIEGAVVDGSNSEPIPFATVQIQGTDLGTFTDENGKFKIVGLCEVEFDIVISHLGYKKVTHHHDIYHPELTVRLAADNIILESVVIEGERSTSGFQSTAESTISKQELDLISNESLGDVLSGITGVSTLKTGQNVVKPIIHGLHSNRVLIINNGVRHESQEWGQEHAPELDPSMAQKISVIKGAAAVKYGPNALGGVIVIDPPTIDLASHLHGEATVRGESNGRTGDGNFLLQQGYGRLGWMAQGAARYQGDLQAADYNLTNTGAREYSYAIGGTYHMQKLDFNLYFSHLYQNLGILRASVAGNLRDLEQAMQADKPAIINDFSYDIGNPRQEVSHDFLKMEAIYNLHHSQFKLQYGFQMNKRREFDVRRGTNNERPSIDLEMGTHTLDLEWIHPEVLGWQGSVGVQGLYQDNNNLPGTNTMPFVPNFNNDRIGVYVVETKKIGSTIYEWGVRYDHQNTSARGRESNNEIYRIDLTYQNLSGVIGFNKSLSPKTSLRMNLASAWRPPNVAELFSFGKHLFTIDYGALRFQINDDGTLKTGILANNEKSIDSEMGLKWITHYERTGQNSRLEVSPYINFIQNYIYNRPYGVTQTARGPFPYFIYEQTDAVFAGVDATLIYEHDQHWESKISGSYLLSRDIRDNDYFIGIPGNKMSYKISYNKKKWILDDFRAGLEASYTFRQYFEPRVIEPAKFIGADAFPLGDDTSHFDFLSAPDGYALFNFSSEFTTGQMVFSLRIKNILNTEYRDYTNLMRYFADEQGINFIISAKIQL